MRKFGTLLIAFMLVAICVFLLPTEAQAAKEYCNGGYYTYTVTNGNAIITDFSTTDTGELVIPDTLGGYPVTDIGEFAFEDCNYITGIKWGKNITNIGICAFSNCKNIAKIIIPDSVKKLDSAAFGGCTRLESVIIPDTVTYFGDGVFDHCTSLKNITFPDKVDYFGYRMFSYCSKLQSVQLPQNITNIGPSMFYECRQLVWVNIPDGVTSIGDYSFYECYSLDHLILPKGLQSIGKYAFGQRDVLNVIQIYYKGTQEEWDQIFVGEGNEYALSIKPVCNYVECSHTWNNGTVITAATCMNIGEKILTCTKCNKPKHEIIPKTTTHNYDNGVNINDSIHIRTCIDCGKEETAAHSWDDGTITREPNCRRDGTKLYSCTGCDATKVEILPGTHNWSDWVIGSLPTCKYEGNYIRSCRTCGGLEYKKIETNDNHSYGSWVEFDSATHKRTCPPCGAEEFASHVWDGGVVTQKPTCKEDGVRTYTCSDCGATMTERIAKGEHNWDDGKVTKEATCKEKGEKTLTCQTCKTTKTETIPKTTKHIYKNDCDTDCNICGVTRTITHKYKTSWSKDKSGHWHECSVCGDKKDFAEHKPGAAATEEKAQTCTVCKYVITPQLSHTHKYNEEWETDESNHWHTCSGCEEKGRFEAHVFDNACDTDCNTCGFTRDTEHTYKTEWLKDASGHWHECSTCGAKVDEAAHIPGAETTETTAQTCTECGWEIAPVIVPAEPDDNDGSTTIIIVACVVGVAAIGGGTALVVIKKKH